MPVSSIALIDRPKIVSQFLEGLDGFIITRGDEYLGEYVAPYAERLAWLTGFTGSAGFALLLKNGVSCVFSDGRYTTQLEEQVPHSLWKRAHSGLLPLKAYLSTLTKSLKPEETLKIGYDPRLISYHQWQSWQIEQVEFIAVEENPIDRAWFDKPSPPSFEIIEHRLDYAGETSLSKREKAAASLRKHGEKAFIFADCTSIMWLLNLRGCDIAMTPLAHGYALLYDDATIEYFVESKRIQNLRVDEKISFKDPSLLEESLKNFSHLKIACDPTTTPLWFIERLKHYQAEISFRDDLCAVPKAIKNDIEQEGSKKAHFLDGIALIRFLYWFENNAIGKYETELSERLESFRALSHDYKGVSFETISASDLNGAYPHYRAEKGKDRQILENSVYLVDSGAQYPFGTTDITRTLWVGNAPPSERLKEHYTRVLKGNIALSQMRFPENIPGYRLDSIARAPLWEAGLDYDHGTGHGIGSYLSVHEGPHSISPAIRSVGLKAGMILSNEPGYYEVGSYGIRIENLLLVKEAMIEGFQGRRFLEFEVLSYTPIDKRLIALSLLNEKEKAWLNHYHQKVLEKYLPHLEDMYHSWLKEQCALL